LWKTVDSSLSFTYASLEWGISYLNLFIYPLNRYTFLDFSLI
jgi:hypothetical protein